MYVPIWAIVIVLVAMLFLGRQLLLSLGRKHAKTGRQWRVEGVTNTRLKEMEFYFMRSKGLRDQGLDEFAEIFLLAYAGSATDLAQALKRSGEIPLPVAHLIRDMLSIRAANDEGERELDLTPDETTGMHAIIDREAARLERHYGFSRKCTARH